MTPDEDVDSAPRVLPIQALSVVAEPGSVKVVHRTGRVVHVFTGPGMLEDMRSLVDGLQKYCGHDGAAAKRLANEVTLQKPWWKWW